MAKSVTTHNSSARRMAKTVLNGFNSYFADYLNATLAAKARFEKADWQGVQQANVMRLELYKEKVHQTVQFLGIVTNRDIRSLDLWRQAKSAYSQLVYNFPNFEIAETFFNSVFADVHDHDKIDDDIVYVLSSQLLSVPSSEYSIYIHYQGEECRDIFRRVLEESEFSLPFEDLEDDLDGIVANFNAQHGERHQPGQTIAIDILESIFYRGKAAYMVGRVVLAGTAYPVILAILNNERGSCYVDTALFDQDDMSVVFSFARNHFMVDAPLPYQYAHFLKQLMPNKRDYEIYNALGFPKHAKTEFYRELVQHLRSSDDQFIIAPGIKGMVMTVFTLPSYNIVFKIIKDKFAPPKEVTHEIVRDRYRLVSRHDRIGRMADTQEFDNLVFPLDRFSPELLAELQKVAASQIVIDGDRLIIRHVGDDFWLVQTPVFQHEGRFGVGLTQEFRSSVFAFDLVQIPGPDDGRAGGVGVRGFVAKDEGGHEACPMQMPEFCASYRHGQGPCHPGPLSHQCGYVVCAKLCLAAGGCSMCPPPQRTAFPSAQSGIASSHGPRRSALSPHQGTPGKSGLHRQGRGRRSGCGGHPGRGATGYRRAQTAVFAVIVSSGCHQARSQRSCLCRRAQTDGPSGATHA